MNSKAQSIIITDTQNTLLRQPEIEDYFDLAAWSIAHERERGVPTYNEYMKDYPGAVPSPPKKTFEEFSSNPKFVADLKRLYKSPDDVGEYLPMVLDAFCSPYSYSCSTHQICRLDSSWMS